MIPVHLRASDLNFGYERSPNIISGWSSDFHGGEIAAITGPSGRGKSTLLYILGLMLKPKSGSILIDGIDAASLSDSGRSQVRASRYGFVFQDAALDATRTVIDNVTEGALYRAESRTTAKVKGYELLARFGVELRADHKPGQVSGGQAQRIALCRALLSSPPILLADEPTGNLDPESARVVIDALRWHAASGAIVLVATHDPMLVSECDREIAL